MPRAFPRRVLTLLLALALVAGLLPPPQPWPHLRPCLSSSPPRAPQYPALTF